MDRPRSLNPKPWVGSCRVLCVRFCWLVWREVYGYVDTMFHRIQLCGFGRVMLAFCLGDDSMYIAASSGLIAKLCQGALTQCRALKHLLYMYFNRGYTNVCMRHLILTHIHTVILLHHIYFFSCNARILNPGLPASGSLVLASSRLLFPHVPARAPSPSKSFFRMLGYSNMQLSPELF